MPKVKSTSAPRSFLIIKPSSLGDIVHALQVVQTVAHALPDCRITWVARDRFAPIVEAAPFVHELVYFHRKKGCRGILEVMAKLRGRRFDVVWDMQGLLRSGLMATAARSAVKWGRHDGRECAWLFSRKVNLPPGNGPHHAIAILQEFIRTLGIEPEIQFPLKLRPGPVFSWQPFFQGDPARCFVIFTDSRRAKKEWKGFIGLTKQILETIPDSRVAWCAGNQMEPDFPAPDGRFLNRTGCSFDEMVELVRQPSVFIGNDSGPMHLSAAVGNRVLAIFGPTSPLRFGPWPPCSPRTATVCAPGGVLADLAPQTVFDELTRLLASE